MSSASKVSDNIHDMAKDARDAAHAAFESSGDFEAELKALRADFARLADRVAAIASGSGQAAWRRAKASLDDAVADAEGKGREAASAVREVSGHFTEALDEAIKTRPYTTLALAAGLAFLLGAAMRR
jgi:ElaB/YqjD/DUF883 family membrane-anchored ribosome-binding protein